MKRIISILILGLLFCTIPAFGQHTVQSTNFFAPDSPCSKPAYGFSSTVGLGLTNTDGDLDFCKGSVLEWRLRVGDFVPGNDNTNALGSPGLRTTAVYSHLFDLLPRATAPASPTSGMIYMDSTPTPDELCVYDGAGWQALITGTDANCS